MTWKTLLIAVLSCSLSCAQDLATDLESEDVAVRRAARAVLEGRLIKDPRQLTFEGRRAGEGYYSWDGSLMVFQSEREPKNPFYQIYLLDLESGDVERVSPGDGKTTCAWIHPDNQRVLYASTHADPKSRELQAAELEFRASGQTRRYAWDYDDHFDLWMRDRRTGRQERLTIERGYDAEACISPDGQWIVFSSNRHAFTEELSPADQQRFEVDRSLYLDLYKMRIDGTELTRLTDVRGYDGGPFFNYDGTKICWRRFNEEGTRAEIWTMNADGTGAKALTTIGALSWAPYFHPSGEYLIFTTNRHGFANFELYLVSAKSVSGSIPPVRVSWTPGFDGLPTFTPTGDAIAWTSNRTPEDQSQLFVAGWDHEMALALLAKAERGEDDLAVLRDQSARGPKTKPAITADDLSARAAYWASDATRDRRAATDGATQAAEELRRHFEAVGLSAPKNAETLLATEMPGDAKRTGLSVLGRLRAKSDEARSRAPLVIGTSFDLPPDSADRERDDWTLQRSACGLAALLEIAEWMSDRAERGVLALERDVIFAGFSLTASGALGARDFLRAGEKGARLSVHAYVDLSRAMAPLQKTSPTEAATVQALIAGAGSSLRWRQEIERRNVVAGVRGLAVTDFVLLDADTLPFHQASVPILAWALPTGRDKSDTPARHDDATEQAMTRLLALIAQSLASSLDPMPFAAPVTDTPPPPRGKIKAWLGTIPDYADAPIPGLLLKGVAPGGPGELAGLRGGDIIVSLDGEAIEDIQAYANVLEDLVVGTAVPVVFVRDGQRITSSITPLARQ